VDAGINDRAIELSCRRHVELALYARGLEIECERLLGHVRAARQDLTTIARTTDMSEQQREALRHVVSVLEQCL
jgi:hypothetical protein